MRRNVSILISIICLIKLCSKTDDIHTLMDKQSLTCFPLSHSVATDEEAVEIVLTIHNQYFVAMVIPIALPHPKVLNFASTIIPVSSASNCNFMTSPQAGAPTKPGESSIEFNVQYSFSKYQYD